MAILAFIFFWTTVAFAASIAVGELFHRCDKNEEARQLVEETTQFLKENA